MQSALTESPANVTDPDQIIIHHSRKKAIAFGAAVLAFGLAAIAILWTLRDESFAELSSAIMFYGLFAVVYLAGLHCLKQLLQDAGRIALTIGSEGVKFDRYSLIKWHEIEDVYFVEDSDGPRKLWLSVKEGIEFLPDGPRPLIWLTKISGLDRSIDISGYGVFSTPDEEIQRHLEAGLLKYS